MAMNFVVGDTDGILVPNDASLTLASSRITLTGWAKPTAGATRQVVNKNFSSAPFTQYQLRLQNVSGTTLVVRFSFQDTQRQTTTTLNLGVWNFVVGTYDGTDLRVYIDGVFDSLTNSPGLTMTDNTGDLGIGITQSLSLGMNGDIDDVRLYDRALSADEILELFVLQGQDQNDHGLVSRWTLAEREPGLTPSGVGVVKDIGPSGNDGDITGTPTYAEGILSFGRRVA